MSSYAPDLCPEQDRDDDELTFAEQLLIASALLVLLLSLVGSLSSF